MGPGLRDFHGDTELSLRAVLEFRGFHWPLRPYQGREHNPSPQQDATP